MNRSSAGGHFEDHVGHKTKIDKRLEPPLRIIQITVKMIIKIIHPRPAKEKTKETRKLCVQSNIGRLLIITKSDDIGELLRTLELGD